VCQDLIEPLAPQVSATQQPVRKTTDALHHRPEAMARSETLSLDDMTSLYGNFRHATRMPLSDASDR
jgi:hypothetical protein